MLHPDLVNGQGPEINTLPPEILSSIFLELRGIRRYKHILPFQVTLSHVCQHWRGVAISTPRLWSTITVFSKRSLTCVDEWLTRSGAVPLDVRLDLYDMDFQEDGAASWIEEALARITSNAQRFQNLFIFTYYEVNIYHVLHLLERVEVPILERLNLCVGRRARIGWDLVPFVSANDFTLPTIFTGGSPKLTFLEFDLLQCIPPLTGITSLHLNLVGRVTQLHFDRLAEILQIPHNLVTLSLRGNLGEHSWSIHHNHPYIQLLKLRNLEISSLGSTAIRFLIFFDIPKLESLRWHVYSDSYHRLLESPQFQVGMNKFPALKYLTLVHQTFTLEYLLTSMQIFPSPVHVLCLHPVIPKPGFRGLQLLDGSQGWEGLQTLAFHGVDDRHTTYLCEEIKSVISKHQSIRKVLVDQDLLSYINEAGGRELTVLGLLDGNAFPDYWWNSMKRLTPERL